MGHCSGGVGAWEIQQSTLNAAITASQNIPFSLIAWVEQGQDPETILGTMHVNDTKSLGMSVREIIASIRTELPTVYRRQSRPTVSLDLQTISSTICAELVLSLLAVLA
jgi:hypothetical protein